MVSPVIRVYRSLAGALQRRPYPSHLSVARLVIHVIRVYRSIRSSVWFPRSLVSVAHLLIRVYRSLAGALHRRPCPSLLSVARLVIHV